MTDKKEVSAVIVESDELTNEITESSGLEATEADVDEMVEAVETDGDPAPAAPVERAGVWSRVLAFGLLPALALLLGGAAAFLKYQDQSVRDADAARAASMQVAKDSTIKLLSYQPDTVEQDLTSARSLLTGNFQESYTQLTNDVVIPGAKQQRIAAIANVPAVASISADSTRAEALVFVNQTVTVGDGAPTSTNSSVKVTLENVGGHWLISEFDPV